METMEARLKIDEIARNFVKWRNNNDASRLRGELYSPDIESTEEGNTSEIGQVKGMEGLKKDKVCPNILKCMKSKHLPR